MRIRDVKEEELCEVCIQYRLVHPSQWCARSGRQALGRSAASERAARSAGPAGDGALKPEAPGALRGRGLHGGKQPATLFFLSPRLDPPYPVPGACSQACCLRRRQGAPPHRTEWSARVRRYRGCWRRSGTCQVPLTCGGTSARPTMMFYHITDRVQTLFCVVFFGTSIRWVSA